jgi:2-desacetyl-2-hydroxyethyl bacteriochlorophyllide A dehydrogenase
MKAAVFKEVGKPLQIESIDDPSPEPDELVLKVGYCGICGTDLHATREGLTQAPCDSVLGHEFVGEIAEVGKHVKEDWSVGDRVCALPFIGCGQCKACALGQFFQCQSKKVIGVDAQGGFSEYLAIGSRESIFLPDEIELQQAALVEPLAIGLHAVRVADVKAGQRILIMGAGPIGLAVAVWSRFFGARDVVISELTESRANVAMQMGATHLVDATGDLSVQFADIAGQAPDIIFECVGAPGLIQACIELAPHRGKIIPVGVCEQPDSFFPFFGLVKELRILFAIAHTKDDFETVVAMLAAGRIDASAMITDVIGLDELPDAFEALRTPSTQCKVLTKLS